jgi:hypothetical protein
MNQQFSVDKVRLFQRLQLLLLLSPASASLPSSLSTAPTLSQLTLRRGSVEAWGLIVWAARALAVECQRRLVKAFIVGRSGADEWWRVGALLVAVIIVSWSGVLAPAGLERFCNGFWLREFQVAGLLGDESALRLGLQLRHQLCDEPASLLRVQVACLFGDVDQGRDDLVMALFSALAGCAA